LLALVGMTLYCVADLHTILAVAQPGGRWPWAAAVLWCAAWPLVAVGMLRFQPRLRRDDDWYDADARVTTATAALSTVAICVFTALLVRDPVIDSVSMGITVLLVAAFGTREAVVGSYRRRLLATLTQHAVHDPLTELKNRRGLL